MTALTDALANKTLEDLQDTPIEKIEVKPTFTKAKIEEALKYLKFQHGSYSSAGAEKYIGKGDGQICLSVGITGEQLEEVKVALNAKIVELTPLVPEGEVTP